MHTMMGSQVFFGIVLPQHSVLCILLHRSAAYSMICATAASSALAEGFALGTVLSQHCLHMKRTSIVCTSSAPVEGFALGTVLSRHCLHIKRTSIVCTSSAPVEGFALGTVLSRHCLHTVTGSRVLLVSLLSQRSALAFQMYTFPCSCFDNCQLAASTARNT
jgi:hypothetical protein